MKDQYFVSLVFKPLFPETLMIMAYRMKTQNSVSLKI